MAILASLAAALTGLASAAPPGYRNTGYCFGPGDGARAPYRIFRYPSRPPLSNGDVGFKWYPMTDATGSRASAVDAGSATNVRRNYFMWANICDYEPGVNSCHQFGAKAEQRRTYAVGNPPAMPQVVDPATGTHYLFKMSSYARANDCTLAQAAYALGYPAAKVEALTTGVGLRAVVDRSRLASIEHDADLMYHDVCVLPDARLSPAVKGVMLDYEVHDGRSTQVARDFLVTFAALVHGAGREAILYTNPLDASGQQLSALNRSNLNDIQSAFDMTTILLFRRDQTTDFAREFQTQLNLLRGRRPVKAPLITFDLARSTMADTATTRNLLLQYHLPGVIVFQKTAQLEGPCDTEPNRKLACLVVGRCQ